MNYIGSKKTLLPFLEKSIVEVTGFKNFVFLDLFAGTGIVGQHFKQLGNTVIANDMMYYSYVLNKNYIENNNPLLFEGLFSEIKTLKESLYNEKKQKVCDYLEVLKGVEGFIYANYSLAGTYNKEYQRLYFSDENAQKIDAIRQKIEQWHIDKQITTNEYFFLLATLIENADKVANTASVYGAFLKSIKKSAQKTLTMSPAHFSVDNQNHAVFNADIADILGKIQGNILYLDPPYNNRQYAPNYHILETIAKYDNPIIRGKTGMRDYEKQKSRFCTKKDVYSAFREIIMTANVDYVFLSYNNEGLMTQPEIEKIMSERGTYGCITQSYNRFKADKTENRTHKEIDVIEYLHYVKCTK